MKNVAYKLNGSDLRECVHSYLLFNTTEGRTIEWIVSRDIEEEVDFVVGRFRSCIEKLGDE